MSDDPVSLGEDGAIRWRGVVKSPDDAERLADHFERIAEDHDWFGPIAQRYASDLRNAIRIQEDSQ